MNSSMRRSLKTVPPPCKVLQLRTGWMRLFSSASLSSVLLSSVKVMSSLRVACAEPDTPAPAENRSEPIGVVKSRLGLTEDTSSQVRLSDMLVPHLSIQGTLPDL